MIIVIYFHFYLPLQYLFLFLSLTINFTYRSICFGTLRNFFAHNCNVSDLNLTKRKLVIPGKLHTDIGPR